MLKACPVPMDDLAPRSREYAKKRASSWLLDADVLSQPAKAHGDRRVIARLEEEEDRCHTSTIVVT